MNLEQVRPHRLVEIEQFFKTYKMLEDKAVDVVGWRDADRGAADPGRGPGAIRAPAGWLRAISGCSSPYPCPDAAIDACRDAHRRGPGRRPTRAAPDGCARTAFTSRCASSVRRRRTSSRRSRRRCGTAAGGHGAFDITLAGAGAFPAGRRPRTLWLGIARGAEELAALVRGLDGPLAPLGWPADARPFRPHLTVARTDAVHGGGGTAVGRGPRDGRERLERVLRGLFGRACSGATSAAGAARYERDRTRSSSRAERRPRRRPAERRCWRAVEALGSALPRA